MHHVPDQTPGQGQRDVTADCFTHLTERPVGAVEQARFDDFAAAFTSGKIELIPAVEDVLAELATRHDLYLMTKGAQDEQARKIEASGLADRFAGIDIVPVKEPATYRRLVAERNLDPGHTWMIGNSPKSDINPALEAGLNAVFVPHAFTWSLEKTDIVRGAGRLVTLERFEDLRVWF